MGRKPKLTNLQQLDIIAALRGEEKVVEVEKGTVETATQKAPVFKFSDDIRKFKTGTLLDEEQNHSTWNTFMIMKILSMKMSDIFVLNYFNGLCSSMTNEQVYIALLHFIPKDHNFYSYIKNIKEEKGEFLQFISKYFECSEKEAQEYMEVMGNEWAVKIKQKFGDFV